MRIALCLHGLVGSTRGKNGDLLGGSDEVLNLSFKHNKDYILSSNVDVFVHSWSTELEQDILQKYQPKKHLIEPQIEFEVPAYIKADSKRAFNHLSRWYSYKEAVRLKSEYETENNFKYDFVLVQRFDLCWNRSIEFNTFTQDKLYGGYGDLNIAREWSDRWFASSSDIADKFASLYDCFDRYMSTGGSLPSSKQYAGISSHFLTKHHAEQLGLEVEFKYNFGGYGTKPDDYNEVRRMYYGDN